MKPGRLRRFVRISVCLALVCLLVVALLALSERTFLARMFTYPENQVTTVDWYSPREPVRGTAGAEELPSSVKTSLGTEAIERAAAYAESKNSSALLILHRGEIVGERYWRGHHRDAQTNSMSMAKTVVALLIGAAIADGKIRSVDEPASTYLTEWARDGRSRITIKHLLQMASGLGNGEHYEDPFSDVGYMYLGTDSLYIVSGAKVVAAPGTVFDYNSINTQALSVVLERATGRRYADYLGEKLWGPIGAGEASVWLDEEGGAAKCFCCLFATARDWARVGLLILNGGESGGHQVIPAAWIAEMTTSSALEPDYGYQIWLGNQGIRREDHEEPFLAPGVAYLDGRFKQRVYVVPSHELVIVRVGENARGWDEAVLVNTLVGGGGERRPESGGR